MNTPILHKEIQDHINCFNKLAEISESIEQAAENLTACIRQGGKILICGNGGSAADSQHFAAELVGRFLRERQSHPAIALTTDTSILTAVGNDYGYHEIYRRQINALGQSGDTLIALSTSGNSENVLHAVSAARSRNMYAIGLSGAGGGKLAAAVDLIIKAPAQTSPRIQEIHIFVLHYWAQCIEANL
jgi:D-sedoheptulose 7-phosphate isomerase